MSMMTHIYRERDYAFGQAIVTLRTVMGLTQVELARFLGISRGAVLGWEAGSSYPKAESLKHLIALGVHQQAFAAEREEEEIRALWRAAHQKVLLDEFLGASARRGIQRQCTAWGSACSRSTG
jgi:transcriptional regulator with XRE-family HTH domain